MKATKKMMMRVAAGMSAALLVAALGLAGCSSEESANEESPTFSTESRIDQIEVPVKVLNRAGDDQTYFDEVVTIGEGSTALDVLQATGLELDVQNGEYGLFVNGVNGVETEGMKGWVYTVNGEQVQTAADQTYLNDGDTVEWTYIDMGA